MCLSLLGRTDAKEVCMKRIKRTSLLEYAKTNRKEGSFNDIEICVGSDRFPCNRMVLSCFSLFFERMFKAEMKEKYQKSVELECMDGDTMKSMIEYIYNGEISINEENVCKLLSAADYLQIEDLKQICINFIGETITPENCFLVYKIAERYNSEKLKCKAIKTMGKNFDKASASEEFKQLSEVELVNCISKLNKSQAKEASKFNAIMRWTNHDEKLRADELFKLLKLIDLYKLPMDFFQGVVLEEELVLQNPKLLNLCLKVQSKHINQTKVKENGSKILSLGGSRTLSKVTEVFNCTDEPPSIYPDLPKGKLTGCAVVLQDHLYFLGGQSEDKSTKSAWKLNLRRNDWKWEEVRSMNKKRSVMAATVLQGNLVVVGDGGQESVEGFSPLFNSWTPLPPLQQPRHGNSLVVCNDRLYAIGGFGKGKYLPSVECLSAGDAKWEYVKPMQTPRRWLSAVSCDGFIYAIGGMSGNDTKGSLRSTEKYNPRHEEWSYVSDMNFARSSSAACVLQGRIFVVGGLNERGAVVKDIECYDPLCNRWSMVGKTDDELFNHSIVAL